MGSTRLAVNSPQTFPDHLPPSDRGLPSSAPLRPVTPGLSSALRRLGGVSPSPKLEETQLGREGVSGAPCILRLSDNRTQTGETPLQGNPETRSPFSLGRNGELERGQEEWEKQLQAGLEVGALPAPPPESPSLPPCVTSGTASLPGSSSPSSPHLLCPAPAASPAEPPDWKPSRRSHTFPAWQRWKKGLSRAGWVGPRAESDSGQAPPLCTDWGTAHAQRKAEPHHFGGSEAAGSGLLARSWRTPPGAQRSDRELSRSLAPLYPLSPLRWALRRHPGGTGLLLAAFFTQLHPGLSLIRL